MWRYIENNNPSSFSVHVHFFKICTATKAWNPRYRYSLAWTANLGFEAITCKQSWKELEDFQIDQSV